jgi:hypothetical protein
LILKRHHTFHERLLNQLLQRLLHQVTQQPKVPLWPRRAHTQLLRLLCHLRLRCLRPALPLYELRGCELQLLLLVCQLRLQLLYAGGLLLVGGL